MFFGGRIYFVLLTRSISVSVFELFEFMIDQLDNVILLFDNVYFGHIKIIKIFKLPYIFSDDIFSHFTVPHIVLAPRIQNMSLLIL